jgi:heme/copper-type cytochrome/quinol oxidase subunit 2
LYRHVAIIPRLIQLIVNSLIFWSASALLVFGEVMILRAWWAGRTPPSGANARRPRAREFVWIALPAIILSATLVATWRAQHGPKVPNDTDVHAEHSP